MKEMDNPVYELQQLNPGTLFEVVGLEEDYRKLTLVNLTSGAAQVKGESSLDSKEEDDDGEDVRVWRPLGAGTCFSLRTPVRLKAAEIVE